MPRTSLYQTLEPKISDNALLRTPQREGFASLADFGGLDDEDREAAVVMPVGCGKSGLITITPFAFRAARTLVVAPYVKIAQQLEKDFDPSNPTMFYSKCRVLDAPPYPEPVAIRGKSTNRSDLDEADVVVTNIDQLQGEGNRWLQGLPPDFFDLILFDEGHHNIAQSWDALRQAFPDARVVSYSATPMRADGGRMAGRVVYSYSVFRAIAEGYVKRLKALVLNPATLKYVRRSDGQEIEVTLEEVRRLGEDDADFRRAIVTSQETLTTIVDASIRELRRIRQEADDPRHKIIAAALNYEHCSQVVEAYRARGLRADYVHSRLDSRANERILSQLEQHELDVIVQVRKLGEGFDHPYLSVAAVLSVFNNLTPFVQFVGRVMRVVEQSSPDHPSNQGSVVFHAGANVAQRWEDFQQFSQDDQEFYDQLLPLDELDFTSGDEIAVVPQPRGPLAMHIAEQGTVLVEEIPLFLQDDEAADAFQVLASKGVTPDDYRRAVELERVPTTKVRERQAKRAALDERVKTATGRMLGERGINPAGHELDRLRLGKENFVVAKSCIDRHVNSHVGRDVRERSEFTRDELNTIEADFDAIVEAARGELFNG